MSLLFIYLHIYIDSYLYIVVLVLVFKLYLCLYLCMHMYTESKVKPQEPHTTYLPNKSNSDSVLLNLTRLHTWIQLRSIRSLYKCILCYVSHQSMNHIYIVPFLMYSKLPQPPTMSITHLGQLNGGGNKNNNLGNKKQRLRLNVFSGMIKGLWRAYCWVVWNSFSFLFFPTSLCVGCVSQQHNWQFKFMRNSSDLSRPITTVNDLWDRKKGTEWVLRVGGPGSLCAPLLFWKYFPFLFPVL